MGMPSVVVTSIFVSPATAMSWLIVVVTLAMFVFSTLLISASSQRSNDRSCSFSNSIDLRFQSLFYLLDPQVQPLVQVFRVCRLHWESGILFLF